jgi:hypothetical protein
MAVEVREEIFMVKTAQPTPVVVVVVVEMTPQ